MADEITLDDLIKQQAAMATLAMSLEGERETQRIQAVAAQLQAMGDQLGAMARALEEQHGPPPPRAMVEVVLTPEQRGRVVEKTGVDLASIRIADDGGATSQTMPLMDPRRIEFYALKEAERRKAGEEARARIAAEFAASLAAIEQQGTPEVKAKLAELRADPSFFGDALAKK